MKNTLVLFVGVSITLASCMTGNQENITEEVEPVGEGPVVVSFKNPQDVDARYHFFSAASNDTTWIGKVSLATLFYDDTQASLNIQDEKNLKTSDPLTINPERDYLLFQHSINYFDTNEYVLRKGDSIQVEYKNKRPIVTLLNRNPAKYDFGIDSLTRSYFKQDKYSPLGKYLKPEAFNVAKIMSSKVMLANGKKLSPQEHIDRNTNNISDFRNQLYDEAKKYLITEDKILDSLRESKEISKVPFSFFKERNEYLSYLMDMQTGRMSKQEITEALKNHKINSYGYPNIYYQQFLEAVEEKYVVEETDIVDLGGGDRILDFKSFFHQVDTSTLFPKKDRDYLLTREIGRIGNNNSHEDFLTYFKQYESKVKDTSLVGAVRRDFALEFDDRRSETASVVLTDNSGKQLTLDEVKAKHKGKVIYVDFWASWCGPCREAMPASAALRKSLKGQDVVFVYLSIDGSISPWKKAGVAENLANYPYSYLVVNSRTSEFLKQNKLNEIPRYMIFDKTGRLTHAKAPRVETAEAGLLLNGLASKK